MIETPCCECGHVEDEHDRNGCTIENCDCIAFEPAATDEAGG